MLESKEKEEDPPLIILSQFYSLFY